MTPEEQKVLNDAKQFVTDIFTNKVDPAFVFHNLEHTRDVVKNSEVLASKYSLAEQDRLVLFLSAWFHDTGYSHGTGDGHEEYSKKIAIDFLVQHHMSSEVIEGVGACIMATKMPQSPTNLIEQIICDADLFHLGTEAFYEKSKMLRDEINNLQEEKVGKKEWRKINIEFLQRHRYFTDYGREVLEAVQEKHEDELRAQLGKKEKKKVEEKTEDHKILNPLDAHKSETTEVKKDKDKDKDKKEKEPKLPERGIIAMFRIMSGNHVNLSHMADTKANIMISVNTIVISIMVSLLLGKLQFYPQFIIPTIILVIVCLGAVVFAILSTRPNVSGGTFTKEDITDKKINLLFFGNFFKMSLEEYNWAMTEMMKDQQYLYESMIKDIYFLGIVLARKYKFLRISYNIFMFGLILAILAFGAAFFFSENQM